MLSDFLGEVAAATPEQVEATHSDRAAWAARLRNAPTIAGELRVLERYPFSPQRFAHMRTPSLVMVGGDSAGREKDSADAVAAALPDARVAGLSGQQHLAMYADPDLFVGEIARFIEG